MVNLFILSYQLYYEPKTALKMSNKFNRVLCTRHCYHPYLDEAAWFQGP